MVPLDPNQPKRAASFCRLTLLVSIALCSASFTTTSRGAVTRTFILWNQNATGLDSLDQLAFETTLRCSGYQPLRLFPAQISSTPLDSTTLLVAPRGAAATLSQSTVNDIIRHLREGLSLIIDGRSPLSRALGLGFAEPEKTSRIRDVLRPGLRLSWPDSPRVSWIQRAPEKGAKVLYADRTTGNPLGIAFPVGKGNCLSLGPLFDARTGRGYDRFPTLPDAIARTLGRTPPFRRRAAEAYLDPAFRTGQSLDSLAEAWKRWGIRALHAAAWYAYDDPPYDYRTLIEACHRNAILVYAWLEWPYIGRRFWNNHPEWRQKNALLQDARFDFLYLMDLQNPACMTSALADLDSLLTLDWDGVDVAEFTLTGATTLGLEGPARPRWFTGFTDYCRTEFKNEQGFDPVELFNPRSLRYWRTNRAALDSFYRYRTRVNVSTQHRVFAELDRINRGRSKSMELILTVIDNSLHPEFNDLLGFDPGSALDLLKEFDVTLQVEDPLVEWTKPPGRYGAMGTYYRRLLGGRPFLIDVNVVPMKRERRGKFAADQAVGSEVLQWCTFAAANSDRVCFYCESTVAEKDWELMPHALAAGTTISPDTGGWSINARNTVIFQHVPEGATPVLDGRPWCAYDESGVIIPAGTHTLHFTEPANVGAALRLETITGELLSARSDGRSCVVDYISRPRSALNFNRQPASILIDGNPASLPIVPTGSGVTILAPPGKHTLVLFAD